jgi:cell division protein FtsB
MSLDDRLYWLIIGCLIGFVLGYLTKMLRDAEKKLDDIKEEVDEIEEIVKFEHPDWHSRKRDERGIMSTRVGSNIALVIVVTITAFAAFQANKAVNQVHETQNRQAAITSCTETYLKDTIRTLNLRTVFTLSASRGNVRLQTAQANWLTILAHKPPPTPAENQKAFHTYFRALRTYVRLGTNSQRTANTNPYPTDKDLVDCIDRRD